MEEAKAKFWTKINAYINKSKSCELDAKKYSKEIRREQEFMEMDLEGGFDYLLGGRGGVLGRV